MPVAAQAGEDQPKVKLYVNNRVIPVELVRGPLPHVHAGPTGGGRAQGQRQRQEQRWLIPLEAAKYLGMRAEPLPSPTPAGAGAGGGSGGVLVRWGAGAGEGEQMQMRLPPGELALIGKEAFIPLERLVQLVGGRLIELEGAIYAFVPQARLYSVSYDRAGEALTLKLSRLAPLEAECDRAGRKLTLRLYNTALGVAPGTSRFTGGRLRGLELRPIEPSQVLLELELPPGVGYRLTEEVSEGLILLRVHLHLLRLELEAEPDSRWKALVPAPAFSRSSPSSNVGASRPGVRLQLTPWISYHREVRPVGAGKVRVDYLLVRRYQERYRLRAALPEGGLGAPASVPVAEMVQRGGAIAGINANFFDPGTGLPIGLVIKDGQLLSAPYGRRAVLGVDLFGGITIFSSKITLYLATEGGELELNGLNEPLGHEGLYLFTSHYGLPIRAPSAGLAFELRGETVRRIVPVEPGDHLPRPSSGSDSDGALLVALGGAARGLHLELGERAALGWRTEPPLFLPLRDAISAGPLLLREGRLALDHDHEGFSEGFARGRAARSAVGITREGDLIMLIAQGVGGSPGPTLEELALLMRELGAVEALALDGGSSASLVFRRGLRLEELGSGREVPVGLILVPRS